MERGSREDGAAEGKGKGGRSRGKWERGRSRFDRAQGGRENGRSGEDRALGDRKRERSRDDQGGDGERPREEGNGGGGWGKLEQGGDAAGWKGKQGFVEDDMPGDEDTASGLLQATIAAMVRAVAKKNTEIGAVIHFVGVVWTKVRPACAAEGGTGEGREEGTKNDLILLGPVNIVRIRDNGGVSSRGRDSDGGAGSGAIEVTKEILTTEVWD
ncbi:hypothetical protein F0562_032345 [Nyssa sinensis]|uniref:Uncharacterized protein n=1 Tax=Nyssa sinensis TaxID=561372 RepID=A0A5J5ARE9_9ASTE|nr:hypothetical protein F0562_032345 [Nyssa sinensis]